MAAAISASKRCSSIFVYRQLSNFSAILWQTEVNFRWDDEVRFVLDQHAYLDCYSPISMKQQSEDRHVSSLGHTILIPSEAVFALNDACLVENQQVPLL